MKASEVFDKLNNIPNVAIEIKPDFSVEFYDSKEELDYAYELRRQYPLTRAEFAPDGSYIRNFELRLWEHAKGRKKGGKYTHFYSMVYKEISLLLLQDLMKLT